MLVGSCHRSHLPPRMTRSFCPSLLFPYSLSPIYKLAAPPGISPRCSPVWHGPGDDSPLCTPQTKGVAGPFFVYRVIFTHVPPFYHFYPYSLKLYKHIDVWFIHSFIFCLFDLCNQDKITAVPT